MRFRFARYELNRLTIILDNVINSRLSELASD